MSDKFESSFWIVKKASNNDYEDILNKQFIIYCDEMLNRSTLI